MKKLSLALVAALSLSTAVFAADGSTGQIKFTGTITEAGCTIAPGNSTAINLGSIAKGTLKAQGENIGWGTGEIKFTDCNLDVEEDKEISAVNLTINSGAKANFADNLWANNAGGATGVGIEVEIGGNGGYEKVLPAGTTQPIVAKIDSNGTAIYKVRGRMVADQADNAITAGAVDTTISFVASYK